MATRVSQGEILLAVFDGPIPKPLATDAKISQHSVHVSWGRGLQQTSFSCILALWTQATL